MVVCSRRKRNTFLWRVWTRCWRQPRTALVHRGHAASGEGTVIAAQLLHLVPWDLCRGPGAPPPPLAPLVLLCDGLPRLHESPSATRTSRSSRSHIIDAHTCAHAHAFLVLNHTHTVHTHTYAVHEQRGSYSPAPVAARNPFHTTVSTHATITRLFTACGCNNLHTYPVPGDKLAAHSIDLQCELRVITNGIDITPPRLSDFPHAAFPWGEGPPFLSEVREGGASKVRLPCRYPWQITLLRLMEHETNLAMPTIPGAWVLRTIQYSTLSTLLSCLLMIT